MTTHKLAVRILKEKQLSSHLLFRKCLLKSRQAATYKYSSQCADIAASDHTETDVLLHDDYFGVNKLFTIRDLFQARVHLGHKLGRQHERMTPYLYGSRLDQAIIDLSKTASHLRLALNVTAHMAYRDAIILFIHQPSQNAHIVDAAAKDCGEYSNTYRWQGMVLTDSTFFFKTDVRLPDLMIFVSTQDSIFEPHPAVKDAARMSIPSVGIVDSDCDPTLITYPVPGNDDTPDSIKLYTHLFSQAIKRGKAKRLEHTKEDKTATD